MLTHTVLLSVAAATTLSSLAEEQTSTEHHGCGDVIQKPVCTEDNCINNICFKGGEKYCDAGCSDISINDSDCTNHARKFTDTSKCTKIVKDNR